MFLQRLAKDKNMDQVIQIKQVFKTNFPENTIPAEHVLIIPWIFARVNIISSNAKSDRRHLTVERCSRTSGLADTKKDLDYLYQYAACINPRPAVGLSKDGACKRARQMELCTPSMAPVTVPVIVVIFPSTQVIK
jgi:hypothetical protein